MAESLLRVDRGISTRYERDLLLAVLAELDVLGSRTTKELCVGERHLAELLTRGVPYTPDDWCEQPLSAARRKAISRAAQRLESSGLLIRVTEPNRNRVTHLLPTLDGLLKAFRLTSQADFKSIIAGLHRTAWGGRLAVLLQAEVTRNVATQHSVSLSLGS